MPVARALRVLVVDDQESMRLMMRNYLMRMTFENIGMAESGNTALKELAKQPCNLVISDINMENGSGLDLVKEMKAHPVFKRIPIIMVTGSADMDTVAIFAKTGVNGYVVKPVAFDALKARVVHILGQLT